MTRFLTIREARKRFMEMPDTLREGPVVITRHGKPVMAALSYEQFKNLTETLELLKDSRLRTDLRESAVQVKTQEHKLDGVGRQRHCDASARLRELGHQLPDSETFLAERRRDSQ